MQAYLIAPSVLTLGFLALFSLAEYLYLTQNVRAEITRKLVHFGTGIITLLFPVLLVSHWQVLFLCGGFLIFLLASLRFGLLPSINAIDRHSYGSLWYPVAVYGTYLAYTHADKGMILFYLPILILAVCDPFAALVGKRFPRGSFRIWASNKTLSGSMAFLISCTVLSFLVLLCMLPGEKPMWRTLSISFLLSVLMATVEAVSSHGIDNLLIPFCAAVALYLLL